LFVIDQRIRIEWVKVVAGLNTILYVRPDNNEIRSGLINMMRVLMKIFNIEDPMVHPEEFPNDPESVIEDVQTILDNLVASISKNASINLGYNSLRVESRENGSWDVFGSVTLDINRSNVSVTMELIQQNGHATLSLLKSPTTLTEEEKREFIEESQKLSHSEFLIERLVGRYGELVLESVYQRSSVDARKVILSPDGIFTNGVISNDEARLRALDVLFPFNNEESASLT
jgi:hypothetical protein